MKLKEHLRGLKFRSAHVREQFNQIMENLTEEELRGFLAEAIEFYIGNEDE